MIDLTSLERALLVLEHGSFRKAAQALGIPTSAVTRRVRALEDAIGVSLFQRQTQGSRPTLAGDTVLRSGRTLLADVRALLQSAAASGSGARGRLRVGVTSSIAGGTTRDLLRAFVVAHPGVELEIVEGSSRDHISAVRLLSLDATFVVDSPAAPDCQLEALWSEPILVALPANHVLASTDTLRWEQIADERFIVSQADPGPEIHDFLVRHLSDFGRHPEVQPRPVQREGLMAMIGLGLGISVVGSAEASVVYPGVVFRVLAGEMLPFSVIWFPDNDNPTLRRFLSLVRLQMRSLVRHATDASQDPARGASDGREQNRDPTP